MCTGASKGKYHNSDEIESPDWDICTRGHKDCHCGRATQCYLHCIHRHGIFGHMSTCPEHVTFCVVNLNAVAFRIRRIQRDKRINS